MLRVTFLYSQTHDRGDCQVMETGDLDQIPFSERVVRTDELARVKVSSAHVSEHWVERDWCLLSRW